MVGEVSVMNTCFLLQQTWITIEKTIPNISKIKCYRETKHLGVQFRNFKNLVLKNSLTKTDFPCLTDSPPLPPNRPRKVGCHPWAILILKKCVKAFEIEVL
jgi:hypothetical protein